MCDESNAAGRGSPQLTLCRTEDLPEIEQILRVSPEAASWSTEALADALRRHSAYFFIARVEQGIAGFISGRTIVDEGEILNLAVRHNLRKHGIATALVSKLLHTFAHEGVAQVFLEVRESNAAAIAFYQTMEFRQIGQRPGYYQNPPETALLLSRPIVSHASTTGVT